MPKIEAEKEAYYKEEIKQIVAFEPKATIPRINQALKKKNGFVLDGDYIRRLRREIFSTTVADMQSQTVEQEVGKYELAANNAMKKIVHILNDPMMSPMNKRIHVAIIKDILDIYRSVVNLKFDAGILSKQLGELNVKHKLSDDELKKRVKELIGDVPDLNKQ